MSRCDDKSGVRHERVTRENPCPICGKPDWCLRAPDGSSAICARVADGAVRRAGEAGWLHRLGQWAIGKQVARPIRLRVPAAPPEEMAALLAAYQAAVDAERLERLARQLGLSVGGLRRFGVGWCGSARCWAFPMYDTAGRVLGVLLRHPDGRKLSVKGSRQGLFLPEPRDDVRDGLLLVAEGATDAVALSELGFDVIGRPNCAGGRVLVSEYVRRARPAEVVVVADRDPGGQGLDGAIGLVERVLLWCPRARIILPPEGVKDARAWKLQGATRERVLQAIAAAEIHRVRIACGRDR
jgi:hypothetical protein